jgi:hypothetical protein
VWLATTLFNFFLKRSGANLPINAPTDEETAAPLTSQNANLEKFIKKNLTEAVGE